MLTVVEAPNPIPAGSKIFLAGTIDNGQSENWQERLIFKIDNLVRGTTNAYRDITILNPRRSDWNPNWEQSRRNSEFVDQVHWELAALRKSDLIIFYFAPGSLSPTTLLELGLFAERNCSKVIYCPEGYWRKGNVDIVAALHNIEVVETEDALMNWIWSSFLDTEGKDSLTLDSKMLDTLKKESATYWKNATPPVEKNPTPPIPPELICFKLKDENTGLFSTGGYNPRWTKQGKSWGSRGALKGHLRQHIKEHKYQKLWINNIPKSWVVVEFTSTGPKEYSARDLYPTENIYANKND